MIQKQLVDQSNNTSVVYDLVLCVLYCIFSHASNYYSYVLKGNVHISTSIVSCTFQFQTAQEQNVNL